jgi:hypothetical protein
MTLLWPMVAVLGFAVLAGLVIALGRGSTARYEYERNGVTGRQHRPAVPVAAAVPAPAGGVPAGAPAVDGPRQPGGGGSASAPDLRLAQRTAVGVAAHPAGKRVVEGAAVTAWWLVDESGGEPPVPAVAGPFTERIEADWAALANGLCDSTRAVFGVLGTDGAVARRQSPQERAWLAELDAQLDRLPEDWDELLSDTDALTTLVVEVAAALVDAGLPLHDDAERPDGGGPAGGACLTPDPGSAGVLVSWRQHDRMSLQQVRGAAADAAVQQTMNSAIASVLAQMGFQVDPLGSGSCCRVTSSVADPT